MSNSDFLPSFGVLKVTGMLFGPSPNELYTRTVMTYLVNLRKFFKVTSVVYGPAKCVCLAGMTVHTAVSARLVRILRRLRDVPSTLSDSI